MWPDCRFIKVDECGNHMVQAKGLATKKQTSAHRDAPGITVVTSQDFQPADHRSTADSTLKAVGALATGRSGPVGRHLIADFWGAGHLADVKRLEQAMCLAVEAAGATLLHIHLHRFDDGNGVTGVALLAESHISIHTWPERDYAAFDIFLCGESDPYAALQVLREQLKPEREDIQQFSRG